MTVGTGLADNSTDNSTVLKSVITEASSILGGAVPGTEVGQYPQSAIDTFNAAIATAQGVVNNTNATPAEIDQAIKDLRAAEKIFTAAKITTDITPPESVTNLGENGVGSNWIRWAWINPTNGDFKHVMIYIDGLFVTNTSNMEYNLTGLSKGTTHIISTKTVDTSGNINPIWVNDSATTSSPSSGGGSSGGSSSRSSTSKSSSSGGGAAAGSVEDFANVAMKDIDSEYLRMNSNVTYEFKKEGNDILSVSFYSLKNSGETASTIEVLNNRSKLVNSNPDGLLYRYINIWVGKAGFATADNIKNAQVKFKVNSSWINKMGLNLTDVRLQRYNGTAWEVLPTTLESNTTSYAIFKAQTPGFSPFAITAGKVLASSTNGDDKKNLTQTSDIGSKGTQPETSRVWTYIMVIVLIGLFAVGYEYLKKGQQN